MDRQTGFIDLKDFSQVEGRVGGVADGDEGGGVQSGSGDEIVVRGRRGFGCAERTDVDYCTLKTSTTTIFRIS